ncbi:MAG: DUF4268 domain-containing protein [Candidatus Electrothrix sp. ATG2]|nr:DUF4268 domain-containing protein [Candidatus Electrothrix sp. ATG2]
MVGKLEYVPLRTIWKHEAYDFTTWLFQNFDVLNEQLGLTVSPLEQEKSVGPFNVDIFGEDVSGRTVIVENQLTRSDHDHLGKLLTYMSNIEAKIAIWIATDPRPEHIAAINFLNENVPEDTQLYLLRLQAFRIGDSEPAPLFTIEAGPSEERRAGGTIKKEVAERDKLRYLFFEELLSKANQITNLFNNISPVGYQNWLNTGAGKAGIMWAFVAMKRTSRAEFFLCHPDAEVNRNRYEALLVRQDEIEQEFGESLSWDFRDSRKQQYIRTTCPHGGLESRENWPAIQEDLIDRLVKLEKAIGPYIHTLP